MKDALDKVPNPRDTLRQKLTALGIPPEAHDMQTLSGMLPLRLTGTPLNDLDADSVAEALIYLIGKEIIRVPRGLDALLHLDWGAHVCQFYRSDEDLLEFLVPYFRKGLEDDEYCVWVAARPSTAQAGREALIRAVPQFETRGIEFVDHDEWYRDEVGRLKTIDVILGKWAQKTQEALNLGYRGLRCAADTSRIDRKNWSGLAEYECEVNAAIGGLRMKAVCAYPLLDCGPRQMADMRESHQDVFAKGNVWWHRIAAADTNEAKAVLMALQGGSS